MKIAYFDLSSGVAGDMLIAALLDAGADYQYLKEELKKISIADEYELVLKKVKRNSIQASHFKVLIDGLPAEEISGHHHHHEGSDHHAHHHEHGHTHTYEHTHGSSPFHIHSHHKENHHSHRGYTSIVSLIDASDLSDVVKKNAKNIFLRLGEAESQAHGIPLEKVHFHEVGAVDSIVDIVGFCICFEQLGIERIYFNEFAFGKGVVKCAHGVMPLPVPATARLTSGYSAQFTQVPGELTTPTGAAILTSLGQQKLDLKGFRVASVGYGAGTREQSLVLGAVRVQVGEESSFHSHREVLEVHFNIDDMTSEEISNLCEELLIFSKQDVWVENINMKKERNAFKVCVIIDPAQLDDLKKIIFEKTSTFGFRMSAKFKVEWERRFISVELPEGIVSVKCGVFLEKKKFKPEFNDCSRIAKIRGCRVLDVIRDVQRLAETL